MAVAEQLTFRIPWAALCSDNRKFLSGKFILTSEYRASKEAIGLYAKAAARKAKWKVPQGAMGMEVVVTEPDHRKRDLNWSKNAKDGITASEAVWVDDSQIRDERWRFDGTDKLNAGATVRIWTLEAK